MADLLKVTLSITLFALLLIIFVYSEPSRVNNMGYMHKDVMNFYLPPRPSDTAVIAPAAINRNRYRFLKSVFQRQAKTRAEILKSITAKGPSFAALYNALVPEVYCLNLVRIGNVNDGGKWVCNPEAMPKQNCSIYSLGLREDITFDVELQQYNNNTCKIHGYDLTPQSNKTLSAYKAINGEAKAVKISSKSNNASNEKSLGDLLHENGDNSIEFLKMDIEGSEYDCLPPFLNQTKPCQILLEMHGLAGQMRDLLVQISKFDYYLFSYEINGDSLRACEYSFIHKSCMDRYETELLASYLSISS